MKNRVQSSRSLQALRIFYFKRSAQAAACVCLNFLVAILCGEVAQASDVARQIFVDDLNRHVLISHVPQRIISLAPSITEMLFAIGAGDQIVGVTQYCDYPQEAVAKPKVGYIHPNLEALVALQPDLVLAPREFLRADMLGKLEQLRIPTYVLDAQTIESIFSHIQTLGRMLGASAAADNVIGQMRRRIEEIKLRTMFLSRRRVLYALNSEPLITVGPGSFIHEAIELAGGSNVAARARTAYPRMSMEAVIKEDPELILFPAGSAEGITHAEELGWQRWSTLSAVKLKRLYLVSNNLLNRPGPRIVQAVEALARIFHPEAFDEKGP
jgi:iron complex transport system substrate-binding protein